MLKTHGRTLAAFAAAIATVIAAALTDGHVTTEEKIQIAVAVANGVLVYLAPNYPNARWIKTAVAVTLGILNALTAALVGGISHADIVNIIIAALGVVAVGAAPSVSDPEGGTTRVVPRSDLG